MVLLNKNGYCILVNYKHTKIVLVKGNLINILEEKKEVPNWKFSNFNVKVRKSISLLAKRVQFKVP